MFLSRVVALALVVATVACISGADVFRLDTTLRPQTHPDSIRFLAEEPQEPYTVIALVTGRATSRGFLLLASRSARRNLSEAAARLGGDAVLLSTTSLTRGGADTETSSTFVQVSGKVIVFDREAAPSN